MKGLIKGKTILALAMSLMLTMSSMAGTVSATEIVEGSETGIEQISEDAAASAEEDEAEESTLISVEEDAGKKNVDSSVEEFQENTESESKEVNSDTVKAENTSEADTRLERRTDEHIVVEEGVGSDGEKTNSDLIEGEEPNAYPEDSVVPPTEDFEIQSPTDSDSIVNKALSSLESVADKKSTEDIEYPQLELYGNAAQIAEDIVQLTPLDFHQIGGAWIKDMVNTGNGFTVTYSYWAGGGHDNWAGGADGIVLLFASRKGIGTEDGTGLGFIPGSIGVELDSYYYEGDDPDGKHVAIVSQNYLNHLAYSIDYRVDDEIWHDVEIRYMPGNMQVFLDGALSVQAEVTLPDKVYVGATASTGNGYNLQLISNLYVTLNEFEVELSFWDQYDVDENEWSDQIDHLKYACGSFSWEKSTNNNDNYSNTDYYCLNMKVLIENNTNSEVDYSGYTCKITAPAGFSFLPYELETQITVYADEGFEILAPHESFSDNYTVFPIYSEIFSDEVSFNVESYDSSGNTVFTNDEKLGVEKLTNEGKIIDQESDVAIVTNSWKLTDYTGSPTTYNHHLAIMAAGFCRVAYDEKMIVEDLRNLGFSRIKQVGYHISLDYEIAYVIAKKTVVIDNSVKTIILCVARGSDNPLDFIKDLSVGDNSIHDGFNSASNAIMGDLSRYIEDNGLNPICVLTGHSYAAAAVNLLAAEIDNYHVEMLSKSNTYAYTFATPNVTQDFVGAASAKYSNIFNIKFDEDAVGYMPSSYYYTDYGNVKYFPRKMFEYSAYLDFLSDVNYLFSVLTGKAYGPLNNDDFIQLLIQYGVWNLSEGHRTEIIRSFLHNKNSVLTAHDMLSYLAWLYATNGVYSSTNELRITKISCPVDVIFKDAEGNVVVRIVDDVIDESVTNLYCIVEDHQKTIFYPESNVYTIEITGNDEGVMDICSQAYDENYRLKDKASFYDIPVIIDNTVTVIEVTNNNNTELVITTEDGNTRYPDYTVNEENFDKYYVVDVDVIGDGDVAGAGQYFEGDKVTLMAIPQDSSVFCGWYIEEKLLSDKNDYTFICTNSYEVEARFESLLPIAEAKISISSGVYTGKAITPIPIVFYGDKVLKADADYTVEYNNNINPGTATVTITGIGSYTGSVTETFLILPGKTTRGDMFNLANNVKVTWKEVPGAKYYKVYREGITNFKESRKDPVIITTGLVGWDKDPGLVNGHAYKYKIVASLTSKGDTNGDSTLSYSKVMYRLKTVVIRSVKNTAPGKVTVKYDKTACGDSYVLQYCERQDMLGAKTKVVLGANKTSYVIGGLKKGKTYYISIRVRKKVDGIDYYTTFGVPKKVTIMQ